MPPILQSITEMYKNQGFDSQASFFEANLPVNVDIPSFDEYKNQLSKINLNSEIDTGTTIIDSDIDTGTTIIDSDIDTGTTEIMEETEKLLEEKPVDIIGKKEDLEYAKFAKNVYKEKDQRDNINGFKYIEQDSDDLLGTYYNKDTNQLIQSIRGTGKAGDLKNDLGITLGSLGGQVLLSGQFKKLNEQIKKNKEKYSPQKLTVTGHSMGGSLSNYIGVANPDYETVTFNMGQGVPFITDIISCGLAGCKNIKNYRIAGDFASSLSHMFSQGSVFQLKPIIPTQAIELEAQAKESSFIPSKYYVPHSIDQFLDREPNKLHPTPQIYGRQLSRGLTSLAGATLLPLGLAGLNSYVKSLQQPIVQQIIEGLPAPARVGTLLNPDTPLVYRSLVEEGQMYNFQDSLSEAGLLNYMGQDTRGSINMFPRPLQTVIDQNIQTLRESEALGVLRQRSYIPSIASGLSMTNLGLSSFGALMGLGVGEISGYLVYENLLKNSEEQYEKF